MLGLNDKQQALFMLLIFILPPVTVWFGLGFPMDQPSVGILASAILSGFLGFLKEVLGWAPPEPEEPEEPVTPPSP